MFRRRGRSISTNDVAVTAVIDFIAFIREIGGKGDARHLFEAWILAKGLDASDAAYQPELFTRRDTSPGSPWMLNVSHMSGDQRERLLTEMVGVLDKYKNRSPEIERLLHKAEGAFK